MRYLATTKADRLPTDCLIIMVDGTVPGWTPHSDDLHWDHHRPGGAEIQVDEMPFPQVSSLMEELTHGRSLCFVTTMTDADACCAAAWVQLSREVLTPETIAKLRAIAWDCDHLMVPIELNNLAAFAAKAVAALKLASEEFVAELGLPHERNAWTDAHWEVYSSEGFRRGTEWLVAAAKGDRPYPGEAGEADGYWQQLAAETQMLIAEQRIQFIETNQGAIATCNGQGLGRGIDPRAFYQALLPYGQGQPSPDEGTLRPETLMIRDHRQGGVQYTLGCLPLHPQVHRLDYTAGTFDRLTAAEQAKDPQAGTWGGRRTVGGSPWNTPSRLMPEEIVALLDSA